jgi:hypothetical protein
MSARGYKIRNQKEVHFISFAVVEWVDARLPDGQGVLQEKNTGT